MDFLAAESVTRQPSERVRTTLGCRLLACLFCAALGMVTSTSSAEDAPVAPVIELDPDDDASCTASPAKGVVQAALPIRETSQIKAAAHFTVPGRRGGYSSARWQEEPIAEPSPAALPSNPVKPPAGTPSATAGNEQKKPANAATRAKQEATPPAQDARQIGIIVLNPFVRRSAPREPIQETRDLPPIVGKAKPTTDNGNVASLVRPTPVEPLAKEPGTAVTAKATELPPPAELPPTVLPPMRKASEAPTPRPLLKWGEVPPRDVQLPVERRLPSEPDEERPSDPGRPSLGISGFITTAPRPRVTQGRDAAKEGEPQVAAPALDNSAAVERAEPAPLVQVRSRVGKKEVKPEGTSNPAHEARTADQPGDPQQAQSNVANASPRSINSEPEAAEATAIPQQNAEESKLATQPVASRLTRRRAISPAKVDKEKEVAQGLTRFLGTFLGKAPSQTTTQRRTAWRTTRRRPAREAAESTPVAPDQTPEPASRVPAPETRWLPDRTLDKPATDQDSSAGVAPAVAASGPKASLVTLHRSQAEAGPSETDTGLKPIAEIAASLQHDGGTRPPDVAKQRFAAEGQVHHPMGYRRTPVESIVMWEAPATSHYPLYFEDVNLERHGHSVGIFQPVLSAAHFFGRVPALPYLMGANEGFSCHYTLGHYRPGSCAPYQLYLPPLSLKGLAYEATSVLGMLYLIP